MKRIILSIPHLGGAEEAHARQASSSNRLSVVGPILAAFKAEFEPRIGLPPTALVTGAAATHVSLRLLGAGATVLDNMPPRVVAYGTPARVVRTREPGEPYLGSRSRTACA